MKVGLLTSFYPELVGGAETSLEALLIGYRRARLEHVLFTLNATKGHEDADLVSVPILRHVPRKIKVAGLPTLDDILGKRLPYLMKRNGVDLLHVLDTYSLCGGVRAASAAGVPAVFTCQNNIGTPFEEFGTHFPLTAWFSARERQVIRAIGRCSKTIAVSDFIAGQLAAVGVSRSRITTVHTGGAMAEWPPAQAPKAHVPLRVFSLGRHYYHKGFQLLLLAAAQVVAAGCDIRVTIAGRGPYTRRLVQIVRRLKLGNRVRFTGMVPRKELISLLDWSDVVVVPSLTPEPFPRSAIEAMSMARPLIGTRVGGIPEIITDDKTGWLVNPDLPADLACRLRSLQDHPELVETFGRNALSECRARYGTDTVVRHIVDVYASVRDEESNPAAGQPTQVV